MDWIKRFFAIAIIGSAAGLVIAPELGIVLSQRGYTTLSIVFSYIGLGAALGVAAVLISWSVGVINKR